jgi:hypothetical protein
MLTVKNLETPDRKRTFEHGEISFVDLGDAVLARAVFRPGWRWSTDVAPSSGTSSCVATHLAYVVSGRLHVRMDDGREIDLRPGDAHLVGPGHDAWVVGDEPCVTIDVEAGRAGPPSGASAGRSVACPCGVVFRIEEDDQLDHLVAAVQQHAMGSHGQDVAREHIIDELR